MEQPEQTERREERDLTAIEQLSEARSIVEKMKRLTINSDYKYLHAAMQKNLDSTVSTSFSAPTSLDDVVRGVYRQGEVAGFSRAMGFLGLLMNGAQETMNKLSYLEPELDKEDEF